MGARVGLVTSACSPCSVELERLRERRDVLARGHHARFVGAAHDLRHDQRGEDAEDGDDHHQLDEGEAGVRRYAAGVFQNDLLNAVTGSPG
jgi:hypothetical protein